MSRSRRIVWFVLAALVAGLAAPTLCQQTEGALCCGGAGPVLSLPSPDSLPALETNSWGVRASLTEVTSEKLQPSAELPAQTLLVVSLRVEDPAWADRLSVDEQATVLLDGRGAQAARLLNYESHSDSPFASLPATREGPRVSDLKLRFHAPPASAPKPLWLDLQLRRYRNELVTFEWRGIGPSPTFPLEAEKQGVSLRVEGLEVANEPARPGEPAREHLVLRVTATYVRATQTAPYATMLFARLIEDAEHSYNPTLVTGTHTNTAIYQGEMNSTTCQTTYHFGDLTSIPDFNDLVVELGRPVELSQPLAVALKAP